MGWDTGGVERGFLRRVMGDDLWQRSSSSDLILLRPPQISDKRGEGTSRLACGEAFGFSTGRRALGEGSLGD